MGTLCRGRAFDFKAVRPGDVVGVSKIMQHLGHRAALSVARGMVLFLKRPVDIQFSVELRRQMQDERGQFHDLQHWIRAHLDADLSIPALARVARMSARNFARVYLRETGENPARAVEKVRVEAAVRLLESTDEPVKIVRFALVSVTTSGCAVPC